MAGTAVMMLVRYIMGAISTLSKSHQKSPTLSQEVCTKWTFYQMSSIQKDFCNNFENVVTFFKTPFFGSAGYNGIRNSVIIDDMILIILSTIGPGKPRQLIMTIMGLNRDKYVIWLNLSEKISTRTMVKSFQIEGLHAKK